MGADGGQIRPVNRGAANFRIHEVRKSPTPLPSGEFSNGASGEITGGGYSRVRAGFQSSGTPPPLTTPFSAWVTRGRRASTMVASTICPPMSR